MLARRRLANAMSMMLSSAGGSIAVALLAMHACAYYDKDDKCGENMVFNPDAHVCMCDSESIKVAGGCERCPSGRVPMGGVCTCPSGTKENDDGECEEISGLGDACDEDTPCENAPYDYCAMQEGGSGTCTKRCEKDDDCDESYTCADWESTPYCRQFSSAGESCSMAGADDPTCDGDADYCFMGQCFVRGCKVTEDHLTDDCPRDRKCCDVSSALKLPDVSTACVPLESPLCP